MGNECCSTIVQKPKELEDKTVCDQPEEYQNQKGIQPVAATIIAHAGIQKTTSQSQSFKHSRVQSVDEVPNNNSQQNILQQQLHGQNQQLGEFFGNGQQFQQQQFGQNNFQHQPVQLKLETMKKSGSKSSMILDIIQSIEDEESVSTHRGDKHGDAWLDRIEGEEVMVRLSPEEANKYDYRLAIAQILSKFGDASDIEQHRTLSPKSNLPNEGIFRGETTGDIYIGQTSQGQKNGFGRLICGNGCFYEGFWHANKYYGEGFFLDQEGRFIRGEFVNHQPNGICYLKKRDGTVYQGSMKNGDKQGYGEETTPKGMSYKGEYKTGKMHGKGEYVIANMYEFKGEFADDVIEGYGTCLWKTRKAYTGQWQNNRMHGLGTFTWPDGKKFSGQFVDDKFEGEGEFLWQNGTCYKGQWRQSKMHGSGRITTPEGKEISGNWLNGEYQWPSGSSAVSSNGTAAIISGIGMNI